MEDDKPLIVPATHITEPELRRLIRSEKLRKATHGGVLINVDREKPKAPVLSESASALLAMLTGEKVLGQDDTERSRG